MRDGKREERGEGAHTGTQPHCHHNTVSSPHSQNVFPVAFQNFAQNVSVGFQTFYFSRNVAVFFQTFQVFVQFLPNALGFPKRFQLFFKRFRLFSNVSGFLSIPPKPFTCSTKRFQLFANVSFFDGVGPGLPLAQKNIPLPLPRKKCCHEEKLCN